MHLTCFNHGCSSASPDVRRFAGSKQRRPSMKLFTASVRCLHSHSGIQSFSHLVTSEGVGAGGGGEEMEGGKWKVVGDGRWEVRGEEMERRR
jgi:hypothetical protein